MASKSFSIRMDLLILISITPFSTPLFRSGSQTIDDADSDMHHGEKSKKKNYVALIFYDSP